MTRLNRLFVVVMLPELLWPTVAESATESLSHWATCLGVNYSCVNNMTRLNRLFVQVMLPELLCVLSGSCVPVVARLNFDTM